eukprot:gnl/Hemi2/11970_TR4092_c1_g1_i1.p3 gnl/Hemi2/11970_TR4092_c1_g1~~gnl/Hemi2/11970_TR4092_c1_g1_i1.p3  ORF type:complete len:156 (+),score=19.94 gnl/Hemi2/11970_TR4092_c1_g1_i1:600-1067(+)
MRDGMLLQQLDNEDLEAALGALTQTTARSGSDGQQRPALQPVQIIVADESSLYELGAPPSISATDSPAASDTALLSAATAHQTDSVPLLVRGWRAFTSGLASASDWIAARASRWGCGCCSSLCLYCTGCLFCFVLVLIFFLLFLYYESRYSALAG